MTDNQRHIKTELLQDQTILSKKWKKGNKKKRSIIGGWFYFLTINELKYMWLVIEVKNGIKWVQAKIPFN